MIIRNGIGITSLLNGNTVKQALNPANETVARGIYVATTLSTVDADLATPNIRNGITLFGFAGDPDVRDISDATAVAAEVIDGETFYAVSGGIRTGTMPIEALDPALNAYPAGYHVGAASLTAVDGDLVAGNIADGVTIFGVLGTLVAGALAAEAQSGTVTNYTPDSYSDMGFRAEESIAPSGEITLISKTDTFTAGSLALAGVAALLYLSATLNLRLYMGGVQVASESEGAGTRHMEVVGNRALSGSQAVQFRVHNPGGSPATVGWLSLAESVSWMTVGLVVGSVKTV